MEFWKAEPQLEEHTVLKVLKKESRTFDCSIDWDSGG